jgi:acyl carrier protein
LRGGTARKEGQITYDSGIEPMTNAELIERISTFINEIRSNKGLDAIAVRGTTSLLDGDSGFDSLDLAALVVDLQSATDYDPFHAGFIDFTTAGELATLFAREVK